MPFFIHYYFPLLIGRDENLTPFKSSLPLFFGNSEGQKKTNVLQDTLI